MVDKSFTLDTYQVGSNTHSTIYFLLHLSQYSKAFCEEVPGIWEVLDKCHLSMVVVVIMMLVICSEIIKKG